MTTNWAKDADTGAETSNDILIGVEHLPRPIKNHMLKSLQNRVNIKDVYHVTEIIHCLRKAYLKRAQLIESEFDTMGLWNIYRGNTFDGLWSSLFDKNQLSYKVEREGKTLTGKLDFVWIDEETFDEVLYDLKMPKNVYFRKKEGAGKFYSEQVQCYMAMAHANGKLLNVRRGRVLFLADDAVVEEVPMNDKILDDVFERIFLLSDALDTNDLSSLESSFRCPEEDWECKFCSAPSCSFRK